MKLHRSAILPFTDKQMFSLVADVTSYAEFLSWCEKSTVLEQDDKGMLAQLDVAYGKLKLSFSTYNTLHPHHGITLQLDRGPFKNLSGAWEFVALSEEACKISLAMDFHFDSPVTHKLFGRLFESIVVAQLSAFEKRAIALYT